MTTKEFLVRMQGYYGLKYNRVMAEEMILRVADDRPEYLDALFGKVIECHAAQYKNLPDVAALMNARKEQGPDRRPYMFPPPEPMPSVEDKRKLHAVIAALPWNKKKSDADKQADPRKPEHP